MRKRFFILPVLFLTFAPARAVAPDSVTDPGAVRLRDGWQYRWGDSPLDAAGRFAWLGESESSAQWHDIADFVTPPGAADQNFVWYRIPLPRTVWQNPALSFPVIAMAFEVYVDSALIYHYGQMEWNHDRKYTTVTTHLVPLPERYAGRTLAVRVYSHDAAYIGSDRVEAAVWIGSEGELVRHIFHRSADSTLLGCLFVFAGLFSLLLGRFRERAFFPFSFGLFAVLIGLFYITSDPLALFLIESPAIKFYMRFISFLLFPVGLYAFLGHIVDSRRIVRGLWLLHLGFAVVALSLDVLHIVPFPVTAFSYNFFFMGTILAALYVALKSAIGGNRDARVFIWGFTVLGLTGLHDILMGLGRVRYWHWLSHWGTLVFLIALAYILERRFTENHRRLKTYSRDLEDKSEQLEEYSRTLEQKVTERTQDLDERNRDLRGAMDELRQTQQQLVMSEKMASLGSLVAGVAHEINNPIGAVSSATDVSKRCLDRLEETIESGESVDAVVGNKHYRTAMRLLRENTAIALEGSGRVTKIVRSLKNFARLDEAEFQEADIHEGLESTLILVHHQMKNRIEIVREYGEVPKIMCYPNQLNQVFMNLLVNSAQAIPGKGTITIKTEADAKNVYVTISDDGKGVPRQSLDKIFDPGFTTKGTGVGTGLGLSISYNIIQKHKGTITATSEPGRGTEIRIALPVS